jgi:hypothetical protein
MTYVASYFHAFSSQGAHFYFGGKVAQAISSFLFKQIKRRPFPVESTSSQTSCGPSGLAETTTSAVFEPCVIGRLSQYIRQRCNSLVASCRSHRDTRNVGVGEIRRHLRRCEGTCCKLCSIQADNEEGVGYREARSGHPPW